MTFRVMTNAFASGDLIPLAQSADGANESPLILWEGIPRGTKSLALLMFDESASRGANTCHWVIYDIPTSEIFLSGALPRKEELEHGIRQGINDFGEVGYVGPRTPNGERHSFVFRMYALSRPPGLRPGLRRDELLASFESSEILGIAEFSGEYSSLAGSAA